MSRDDLLSCIGHLIAKPPEGLGFAKHLSELGSLDGWRQDIKSCVRKISEEGSWELQKYECLRLQLQYAKFIAMWGAASNNEGSVVWQGWFTEHRWFKGIPKKDWLGRLAKLSIYSTLNVSLLHVVGMACYGIKDRTDSLVIAYQGLQKELHSNNISFNETLFQIRREYPRMRDVIDAKYAERIDTVWKERNNLMRWLANQICTEGVHDAKEFGTRWANLADRQNELLVQIGAEALATT